MYYTDWELETSNTNVKLQIYLNTCHLSYNKIILNNNIL